MFDELISKTENVLVDEEKRTINVFFVSSFPTNRINFTPQRIFAHAL